MVGSGETRIAALADRILRSRPNLVLVDALPGTGKTMLLRHLSEITGAPVQRWPDQTSMDRELTLVDLEPGTIMDPEDWPGRLVVAGRPDQVNGHMRLRLYGELFEIGNRELFLSPDEDGGFSRSGGWPALSTHFSRHPEDEVTVIAFLVDTVLPGLDDRVRSGLHAIARSREGLPRADIEPRIAAALDRLVPLVECRAGNWRFRAGHVGALFLRAFDRFPMDRDVGPLLELAGMPAAAIRASLGFGSRETAAAIMERAGGVMLGHIHGPAEARAVIDTFGDDRGLDVLALRVMTAMKAGHPGHARQLLEQAMGNGAGPAGAIAGERIGAPKVPAALAGLPPALRMAWLLLGIYSDRAMGSTDFHSEYASLLAEVDLDDHLLRGAVYNVALDEQIRAGRHGEAKATAGRAIEHYRVAEAPYLTFYIHVHLALMHLGSGAPGEADSELEQAQRELAATQFDTPQDDRFLALLKAQVAYEQGRAEPMVEFAASAFDGFAYGELWPSIAAQALAFGAESLLRLRGPEAALRYLDAWRVQTWRTRRFRLLIEQREVLVLQSARRWREARRKLEAMATRIGAIWIDSSGENLTDLRDAEDVAQALIWLRQHTLERPRDRALGDRLASAQKNPHLSWRQRRQLGVWQAWAARRQGRVTQARRQLAETISTCVARQCTAPLIEERALVNALVNDPRMSGGPMELVPVPHEVRTSASNPFEAGPLSRQEWRALLLLAEGCSNKEIAREMAVSVPTVKFHLKNVYAKLDVADRRTAVAAARGRGLLEA